MLNNEDILEERLKMIKSIIKKYGEKNFYLSFSGGKDSTVLHYLIDMALPNNKIPRVFINTGIEYLKIVDFVKRLQETDPRIVIITPSVPIVPTLKKYGYPFKSKEHSHSLNTYQNSGFGKTVNRYLTGDRVIFSCPKCLKYQFSEEFTIKVSDKCCNKLKKEPVNKWAKENSKTITITGMRKAEGGQRTDLGCILKDKDGNLTKFHPLAPVNDNWVEWFIETYKITLCELYYPPFNFKRTGCKGCPFALDLQEQLNIMSMYLPNEKKACEAIWKPVYDEYRRLNYRLKSNQEINIFD